METGSWENRLIERGSDVFEDGNDVNPLGVMFAVPRVYTRQCNTKIVGQLTFFSVADLMVGALVVDHAHRGDHRGGAAREHFLQFAGVGVFTYFGDFGHPAGCPPSRASPR